MDSVQLKDKPRSLKPRAYESKAFDQTNKSMQQIIDMSASEALHGLALTVKTGLEAIQRILPDGRQKKEEPVADSQADDETLPEMPNDPPDE
jgi:lipoate-protein ligase B